jgi:DNA mismatch endonuclease (patch repair protein)
MQAQLKSTLPCGEFKGVSAKRSAAMRSVRSKGNRTSELRLRLALVRARVTGWEVQPAFMYGRPDFVFRKEKIAVFVDGCFWHGCETCGHVPRKHSRFWKKKLALTKSRDLAVTVKLRDCGFRVLRLWEHELESDLASVVGRLLRALKSF